MKPTIVYVTNSLQEGIYAKDPCYPVFAHIPSDFSRPVFGFGTAGSKGTQVVRLLKYSWGWGQCIAYLSSKDRW